MINRIVVALAVAVAVSFLSGAALAQQPAGNQNREGMRLEQVPPKAQNAQAQTAPQVDPTVAVAAKIVKWKNERLACLVQAGLNRPTTGFGQRGDDFVITEQNRILVMDSVWARPGIKVAEARACTKVEE